MNVLVTGGSGFIGSHLIDRLLTEGNTVTLVDRSIKYYNLPEKHPNLKLYHYNIFENVAMLFTNIEVVYHLAALTRPQWSIKHPYEMTEINVMGTIKVLEYARDASVKRFVFISTSDIYGDVDIYPTPEDIKPNPLNSYALSKLVCEQYIELFSKLYDLEYNILRPFNIYGSRMPLSGIYTSAVAAFIHALKTDNPIKIYGTGKQTRDFLYIDDLIDMLVRVATSKVKNEAFNCGSGTYNSINEIADLIQKIMKKKAKIEILPAQFEKKQTLADINKPKKLLGWKPKVSLEEGLKKTI